MTRRHKAQKRKREKDDIHELEGQRYSNSTPATFLAPGCTEFNDVTAKDSVLKNPDLMAMIFSHLQNCRYLFNAALTCKDFLDVALDALWEELDSLVPLLSLLPALQLEDGDYVLSGKVSKADWDRLQYYSRKVKSFLAFPSEYYDPGIHYSTFDRIAQKFQSSFLFPSLRHLYCNLGDMSAYSTSLPVFLSPHLNSLELSDIYGSENTFVAPFLASLSSQILSRIVLRGGKMLADTLKESIVRFKHLRSLELLDAIFMSDFVLFEVLGTLPSLENLTLMANDPECHPAQAPESSNSQSGGRKYFEALESVSVTGSFFLIQHLLGFIDSPCLKSIDLSPLINHVRTEHDPADLFTRSMTIVASKWSQSLKHLVINSSSAHRPAIPKCLMLLTDLHEMQTFHLTDWGMEIMDDDVRRLAMSWPKLRTLRLPLQRTLISLTTLGIIAENCPVLRYLDVRLDTSTIPPFDTSRKSLRHNLKVLTVGKVYPSETMLEGQIQVARHLDFIFPYLKSIKVPVRPSDVTWSGIRDLVKLCQDARQVK